MRENLKIHCLAGLQQGRNGAKFTLKTYVLYGLCHRTTTSSCSRCDSSEARNILHYLKIRRIATGQLTVELLLCPVGETSIDAHVCKIRKAGQQQTLADKHGQRIRQGPIFRFVRPVENFVASMYLYEIGPPKRKGCFELKSICIT